MSNIFISVIGASLCTAEEAATAEAVGRELAKRGVVVVCGGLGGVMEAVCRGAVAEKGLTIGILPGESPLEANPYVKIPIVTGLGYARNAIVVKTGHAVIAIGGSWGTLSEIAYSFQYGLSVVGLNTWSIVDPKNQQNPIVQAKDPIEAVDKALALIRPGQRSQPYQTAGG